MNSALALAVFSSFAFGHSALAQGGSPVPGSGAGTPMTAPAPGSAVQMGAPVPGRPAGRTKGFSYADLPLNTDDAKAKIVELTNVMSSTRPQEMQDRINQFCEWLGDMVEAHNRMANAFTKHDLKGQAASERQAAQRFSQLKNQAMLLKADLLINMHRFPEALGPLVDIVIAEPTSATGKSAYKKLQQLGFSQDVSEEADAEPAAAPAPAPKTAAPVVKKTVTAVATPVKKVPARSSSHRH